LRRRWLIKEWFDGEIVPGESVDAAVAQHLKAADLIVMLLSQAYVDSDYCWDTERTMATHAPRERDVRVVGVVVRPVHLKGTERRRSSSSVGHSDPGRRVTGGERERQHAASSPPHDSPLPSSREAWNETCGGTRRASRVGRASIPALVETTMPQTASLLAPFAILTLVLGCTSDGGPATTAAPRGLPAVAPPLSPFDGSAYQAAAKVPLPRAAPEDHPELHNVLRLSEDIVSGSEPHGEDAFRILQEKGIRTILSVDGKVPDAGLAEKYGMKYVHVPIQYKGISDAEVARIAKTFREQEGPFFVHCFHGKHRGPAAAEIGRLVLDGISRETAIAEMRQWCGTAESYEGLYRTVAYAEIPDERATHALRWDFPAASPLEGIAGAMVLVSRADDHIKALSKNAWQPDPGHPDVDPLNEAAKLADLFARAVELEEVADQPADFRQWIQDSKVQSAALLEAVRAVRAGAGTIVGADGAYKELAKTCTACHDIYRN